MKNYGKKVLCLALLMVMTLTTGLASDAAMTDGIYQWKNPAVDLQTFIRFNADGSYYAKFFDGGVVDAGTYAVLDEAMDYSADGGADGDMETVEDNTTASAPQVIELTSYQGGDVVRYAFAENEIRDASLAGLSNHCTMEHNAAYAYDPDNDEIAIVVQNFFPEGDEGSSLTLYHNRTFVDYTGESGEEGIWEQLEAGSYKLISEEDAEYTLTVDGGAAVYHKGGEEIALGGPSADTPVLVLEAKEIQVGLPMGVDFSIECYEDNTCKALVYVAAVDATMEVDNGSYAVSDIFNYTFTFATAGELASEADYASATESSIGINLTYKADVIGSFMDAQTPMTVDTVLAGVVTMN